MKFTVARDALAEAVTWAARALPGRPVLPLLTGLLLSAGQADETGPDDSTGQEAGHGLPGKAFLTLSCFDYEVSARVRIPSEVAEPGTVLVPGRLLVEIIRALPGHPVEFADDPDGVSVTCGDAAFLLTPLPLADYPELPELPQLAGTVDGGELATAIGQVTPAASRDDTLPMLTAVNVELDGETMTLAATDRYRLAVRELAWRPAPALPAGRRVALLVPARTLGDAARMMSGGTAVRVVLRSGGQGGAGATAAGQDGAGRAGAGRAGGRQDGGRQDGRSQDGGGRDAGGPADAMIGFEAGQRRLTTRLLAGEFVRYRSRFPDDFGCTADLPAEAFAEAVRRVALVAERGTPVQLSFAPGRVTIGAATQGQARAKETVAAEFTGNEPSIAFSAQYLLDGVVAATAAAVDGPEPGSAQVRLRFTSAAKPAVITPGPGAPAGFRYLVVPQRLR